ncbi:MAG: hypothetical protein FWC41_12855 [Firmicutes bacterium]|nr:hypothetical protein [Bacillota bacterium]
MNNKDIRIIKRSTITSISILLISIATISTACAPDKTEQQTEQLQTEQTEIVEIELTGHDDETQHMDEEQTVADDSQNNDGRVIHPDGSYSLTTHDHLIGYKSVKDFDADGNLIKITNYIRDDIVYSTEEYDFDRDVLVITTTSDPYLITEYNVKLGESILYENFTEYYYHDNDIHDFYIVVEYEARDDGGMNEKRSVFGPGAHEGFYLSEFNADGYLVKKTSSYNGKLFRVFIYDRDENNREIGFRIYDKDGNRVQDD